MIFTIEVAADNIARGVPESACFCPVALALRQRFGIVSDHGVEVFPSRMAIARPDDPRRRWVETPAEVARRIDKFDRDGTMEPFAFELEIPDD